MEPTYEKVKAKMMARVEEHKPITFVVSLDGWTAMCHSYIGFNCHYLKNWKRYTFHVYCQPFDHSHTAVNIRDSMEEHLRE